jgi:hypothetical protein
MADHEPSPSPALDCHDYHLYLPAGFTQGLNTPRTCFVLTRVAAGVENSTIRAKEKAEVHDVKITILKVATHVIAKQSHNTSR